MTDKEIFDELKKHIEEANDRIGIEAISPIDTVWYVETNGDIIESTLDQKTGEIVKRIVGGVGTAATEDLEEILNEDILTHSEAIDDAS